MKPYIHFTDEQKLRAGSVDLAEFLRRRGEALIPSGRDKRLAGDHSITVRGNQWYDHSAEEGGGAISFVQSFYGLSYPEAVTLLLNGEQGTPYEPAVRQKEREKKEFVLPPAHSDMRRVFAYLIQHRQIGREIVTYFAKADMLYQSAEPSGDGSKVYHNAVFVGHDEYGVPRHAHKRGLYTQGKGYRGNVDGCDPAYSFHHKGSSGTLYVFEAPIDLLSFITLYPKEWQKHSYAALCGVSEHAMLKMLELDKSLRRIALCLDHDEAGIEAAGRLTELLRERGYNTVAPLLPKYKDWNEDLNAVRGLPAVSAEEHPQFSICGEVCQRVAALCGALPKSECPEKKLPALLERYRGNLYWGQLEQAAGCLETMAALSVFAAAREYRQLGRDASPDELSGKLRSRFLPHRNRGKLQNRTAELSQKLYAALALFNADGIRPAEEKERQAASYMELALDCVMAAVRMEADAQKQEHREQLRQADGMSMQ